MSGGKMKTRKFTLAAFGLAVLLAAALSLLLSVGAGAGSRSDGKEMRWDIVQLSGSPPTLAVSPGGKASADAEHGNTITITGTGTFRPGKSRGVSGGGTWATTGPEVGAHNGTFEVTRLVSFELAPGFEPATFTDNIGRTADFRGGLAVLQIAYSDGSKGVLIVSCHAPAGAPDSVFEGITASKGFVDFWNREAPTGAPPFTLGTNENRTQFHVLPGEGDD
jgi:hypothetical protein